MTKTEAKKWAIAALLDAQIDILIGNALDSDHFPTMSLEDYRKILATVPELQLELERRAGDQVLGDFALNVWPPTKKGHSP